MVRDATQSDGTKARIAAAVVGLLTALWLLAVDNVLRSGLRFYIVYSVEHGVRSSSQDWAWCEGGALNVFHVTEAWVLVMVVVSLMVAIRHAAQWSALMVVAGCTAATVHIIVFLQVISETQFLQW
jgi:hypothetical protein